MRIVEPSHTISPPGGMEQIQQQVKQLEASWGKVYKAIEGNPSAYASYLPNATAAQLNEVVRTIAHWLGRVRAPRGFAPGFHVAKGVAATALASALPAVQAMQRGEYGHMPAFVAAANQVLSAIHTMIVFSAKPEARDLTADLAARFAEGLALLETAQHELSAKVRLLDVASGSAQLLESRAKEIDAAASEGAEKLEALSDTAVRATESAEEIAGVLRKAGSASEKVDELVRRNVELQKALEEQQLQLNELTTRARQQEELIAALLPKGASAGLASAFAQRVSQVELTKRVWIGAFVGSVVLLLVTAFSAVSGGGSERADVWVELVHRLPIAAPLVWLGWFSAIQYGNTVRIQEDYAFKEATSKAYAGYRDHMEHMANLQLDEGNSAMLLLSAKTIEILAREPLRIFGNTERDASPSHSLFDAIAGIVKRSNGSQASPASGR